MFSPNQFDRTYFWHPNEMERNMGNYYYPGNPYITGHPSNPAMQYAPTTNPYYQSPLGGYHYQQQWQSPMIPPSNYGKNKTTSLFDNPLEPVDNYYQQNQMMQQHMNYNPYPKPNMIQKPNGGFGTILNSFKGQDGNIDLNKMMNTAGQMVNAVSQVSAMVKGLGGIFKV
ncbi:YppG family protein [Pseudoneobacillus sp. C159]